MRCSVAAPALVVILAAVPVKAQNPKLGGATGELDDDRAGIEKLHREDVAATLSGDSKALTDLFSEDGVRLGPGSPPLVGKKAILAENQKQMARHPEGKVLTYKPEVHDLQIANGWASEWTTFEATFRLTPTAAVETFRAKTLRVLKRLPDGSWKFARVMWNEMPEPPKK
jgi:uncharacterized protein (TIGR02246 family)